MRTIAVLNQKGGVGKTTTAVNTAAALAAAGSKVVVIDLDPQAHMTIHLGLEPQALEAGSYKVLTQSAGFEEQIMLVRSKSRSCSCVPTSGYCRRISTWSAQRASW
jgi:chromosome partitioning protein